MGLSNDDVERQRQGEMKLLRRWISFGLAGSSLLHGLSLSWSIQNPWQIKPRPTEVVVVPRRTPVAKPIQPSPTPEVRVTPEPEVEVEPRQTIRQPAVEPQNPRSNLLSAVLPEGEVDAVQDESPLVGSGLAAGEGGFVEGIGLNRSASDIQGTGGGERRGVEGGVPGADWTPPIATAPSPLPLIEEQAEPEPELSNPRQAVCRRCPPPEYPRSVLQAGVEGRVQMAVDVDSRGNVVNVRLANSSGDPELDRVVLETVRERWRFEAVRGGVTNVPVEVYMTVNQSELNQRARNWGDRTTLDIPASGFAAPPVPPAAAVQSSSVDASVPSRPASPISSPVPSMDSPTEPSAGASAGASTEPSAEPSVNLSTEPLPNSSTGSSTDASIDTSTDASSNPSAKPPTGSSTAPLPNSSAGSSTGSSINPLAEPSAEPSIDASIDASAEPLVEPLIEPLAEPSIEPFVVPVPPSSPEPVEPTEPNSEAVQEAIPEASP